MPKEMVISSSSHETKIAILEDGQVVEVYYEREKEYSLAGSIYKGRVTRILPGMQSAFVNIGLERDTFLYVSDFLEGIEEYDRVLTTVEERDGRSGSPEKDAVEAASEAAASPRAAEPAEMTSEPPAPPVRPASGAPSSEPTNQPANQRDRSHRFSRRSRRHRQHPQRGFPDSKYSRGPSPQAPQPPAPEIPEPLPAPTILPGESLAKYKDRVQPPAPTASESATFSTEISMPGAEQDLAASVPTPPPPVAEFMRHDIRHDDWTVPPSEVSVESEPEPAALSPLAVEEAAEPSLAEELSPRMEAGLIQPESPLTETSAATTVPDEDLPAWERLERQYEETIASEPHSGWLPDVWELHQPDMGALPEAPPAELGAGEAEAPATDDVSEPFGTVPESAETTKPTETAEAPREAAVRERPANPRYQRRQRWAARRQPRGEEARPPRFRPSERETPKPLIGDLLKEGQEIIVQVAKEPLGKKGARITSHIALPGRYLVYMPTLNHVGVSRKIASDEERHRLKRIIAELTRNLPGGFIVRTAGVEHTEEKFRQDIEFLVNLWAEIKAKAEKSSAPLLLHHDLDVVLRTLRDQLSDEFSTIWVDNEQTYEEIVSLVQRFQPALVNRVRLYTKDVPLFEETGVQEEINRALRPKVWLKSGGYIVINQTEALVAIDVNTGKFVGKSNRLEDTIVKTNVEAIQEIVRQIRLRDLGGIIVIDFIDMDERRNRQKVMLTLEEAMKADRAPSKSLAFNEFGLVAITRKRVRQSLERTLCQPCAYCSGSGFVKSPATICLEILAEARKMAAEIARKQVTLRVNPEVGKALKARENAVLAALEELTGRGVIIRSDPAVHIESFYFD